MKQHRYLAVILLACASCLTAAPQADKQPITSSTGRFGDPDEIARKYRNYMFGVVASVNETELVLSKTKYGVDQSFRLTKRTRFTVDGKPSTFDKLKPGEGVYVDLEKDKRTGDLIVKKVVSGVDIPSVPTAQ